MAYKSYAKRKKEQAELWAKLKAHEGRYEPFSDEWRKHAPYYEVLDYLDARDRTKHGLTPIPPRPRPSHPEPYRYEWAMMNWGKGPALPAPIRAGLPETDEEWGAEWPG